MSSDFISNCRLTVLQPNLNYPRDLAKYIAEKSILSSMGFVIQNSGSILAGNARLEINAVRENYKIIDQYKYPKEPEANSFGLPNIRNIPIKRTSLSIDVKKTDITWNLTANFGNVQPGATVFCEEQFFIGAKTPCVIRVEAVIYADNLPKPITVPLTINIETKKRKLDLKELE